MSAGNRFVLQSWDAIGAKKSTDCTIEEAAGAGDESCVTKSVSKNCHKNQYDCNVQWCFADWFFRDSLEEEEAKKSEGKSSSVKESHEQDLLYDPEADDRDEKWIENKRNQYLCASSHDITSSGHRTDSSDAVLNCPACMSLLCLDCQRHETFKSQYRAMFVQNCSIDFSQELHEQPVNQSKRSSSRRNRSQKGRSEQSEESDETSAESSSNTKYFGVKCDACGTQVAVYDQEEVYHFFNVLASHCSTWYNSNTKSSFLTLSQRDESLMMLSALFDEGIDSLLHRTIIIRSLPQLRNMKEYNV